MKTMLMIAYYFPPIAGGGVQRTLKFAKYLSCFDWKPIILTAKEGYDSYYDETLKNDISDETIIYRTATFDPVNWIRKKLKKTVDLRTVRAKDVVVEQGKVLRPSWLLKMKEVVFIPDIQIGWLPFAVFKAWVVIRREKLDIIFSTSSPYTSHLIGFILKKISGKPWIADFRDPWSANIHGPQLSCRRRIDRLLEKLVLKSADRVITTTKPIADDFQKSNPLGHYSVITNGYDQTDFKDLSIANYSEPKFNMTYTGILYRESSPKFFLQGLADLMEEKPELREDIIVRFVGQFDKPGENYNFSYLKSLPLEKQVELVSYVSHEESLRYAISSDVLLLFINDVPGAEVIMTGKIFEYLACKKPVMAMVPFNGVAAELIRDTSAGVVVPPQSVDEIKKTILSLYSKYIDGTLHKSYQSRNISGYSRYNLTRKLVNICDQLIR